MGEVPGEGQRGAPAEAALRRQAEELALLYEAGSLAEELALLYEAGSLLGQTLDPARVYTSLRDLIARIMDCDGLLVSSYTPEDNALRCSYAWIEGQTPDVAQFPVLELAPLGQGLQSGVIRTGEPVLINDFSAYAQQHRTLFYANADGSVHKEPTAEENATHSLLMVPIELGARVLGTVQVQSHRLGAYTADHLRVLRALASQVAAASRNAFLYRQVQDLASQQRAFLRQVLLSVTEGKLRLCDDPAELPAPLPAYGEPVPLGTTENLGLLRNQAQAAAVALGFPELRWQNLISATSEAAMNAIVHAGGGIGRVCHDAETVQVWVEDQGQGITMQNLPRATLERGWTTAGTLGHGFWLILHTIDRIFLLTGPTGTTVVLEQNRSVAEPDWFAGL